MVWLPGGENFWRYSYVYSFWHNSITQPEIVSKLVATFRSPTVSFIRLVVTHICTYSWQLYDNLVKAEKQEGQTQSVDNNTSLLTCSRSLLSRWYHYMKQKTKAIKSVNRSTEVRHCSMRSWEIEWKFVSMQRKQNKILLQYHNQYWQFWCDWTVFHSRHRWGCDVIDLEGNIWEI